MLMASQSCKTLTKLLKMKSVVSYTMKKILLQ